MNSLLTTVTVQFTTETTDSKKAIYLLSLMSYSVHKPRPRKLCVVLFYVQKKFGPKMVGGEKRLRSSCENIEERSVGILVSFKRLQISWLRTML